MKPERQRIAIAEACGWDEKSANRGFKTALRYIDDVPCNQITEKLPHYVTDLNAMHEAEKVLNVAQAEEYINNLCEILDFTMSESWTDYDVMMIASTTAAQRAEAFLKTLGLWEGGNQ